MSSRPTPPPAAVAERISISTAAPEPARWDAFVEAAPRSSFCHLLGWREVMEDVLGHRCEFVVAASDSGEWLGVLPLVEVRSRLFGRYLVSMPFLNYGGPLGSPAARTRLAQHAAERAAAWQADLLELRTRGTGVDGLSTAHRKLTVTLPLPASVEELWRVTFRAKLRSQIRRPQKDGMVARFGTDQLEPFYDIFARNMRDLGTPVLPRRFFERLAHVFPRQVVFSAVWRGDVPVAAGCGFVWAGEYEMTWASSLREHNRSAPNMLLYAACMEEMIARGVRVFNFGRCTPGGGTHRFKLQWGGLDEPLPWSQWSARGRLAPPSPDRPAYRLAGAAWRRLPLALANRLGPPLARCLP
jgi:serine/alanine adding enzyme